MTEDEQVRLAQRLEAMELLAAYQEVRRRLVRRAIGWGALAIIAALISLASYQAAGSESAVSGEAETYYVWWGPVMFGGWRALTALVGIWRLDRAIEA